VNSRHPEREEDIKQKLSERVVSYFIGKYIQVRYKAWMFRKEANESELSLQDLSRICLDHVEPATSPLALISEIQGSGGSLVSQLFDGHPELHVHPHELMIGYPEQRTWPKIDLSDSPGRWFEILFEDVVDEYNREGYKKEREDKETFPFVFISSLQKEIFLNYFNSIQSITMRGIFDAYMTSYFGAWLNNQNYYGSKKFITAHTARLGIIRESTESFFQVYPDGRLICVLRDPKTWFPSTRRHWPGRYVDVGQAISEWNKSTQAMLWNKKEFGDCVCLIKFEDLISKTEAVMRFLAKLLTVEFDDFLMAPTFNKFPMKGARTFTTESHGVVGSLPAEERTLTGQELDTIENMTSETYALVLEEVVSFE
jgi:hypothetical protein